MEGLFDAPVSLASCHMLVKDPSSSCSLQRSRTKCLQEGNALRSARLGALKADQHRNILSSRTVISSAEIPLWRGISGSHTITSWRPGNSNRCPLVLEVEPCSNFASRYWHSPLLCSHKYEEHQSLTAIFQKHDLLKDPSQLAIWLPFLGAC